MDRLLLLLAVVIAGAVAVYAFLIGDRRRRRATGLEGPRPAPSIGEAVRLAGPRGRAVVFFLGDDPTSVTTGQALAEDAEVLKVLAQEGLAHTVIRHTDGDRDVAQVLHEKYAKTPLPEAPTVLLLDGAGARLATTSLEDRGALGSWLGGWVDEIPPRDRTMASK